MTSPFPRTLAAGVLVVLASAACRASQARSTTAPTALTTTTVGHTTVPPTTKPAATTPGPPASVPPTSSSGTTLNGAGNDAPCGRSGAPPAGYQHVIWIWMENHSWPQVLGNPQAAPYETSLARNCATATNYATVGSPSLPNYLAATSGSSHGINDDGSPSSHPLSDDNLFRQVRSAGGSERSYQEDMAGACQLASSGRYAVKHNPAAYYVGGGDRNACQADDLPFTAFTADLANDHLPTFAFVTPNLCNDTHDCGVGTGDAWLARILPGILASGSYRAGTTAVFVIWDEDTPTPNLFIAPSVRPGTLLTKATNHFGLLATTEEMLGLAKLGSAATSPSLRSGLNL